MAFGGFGPAQGGGGTKSAGSADDIQGSDGAGGFTAPGAAILSSNQINAAAGTAALPSVVGDSDTNTGLAWLAGDELSLCAAGAMKAEITGAGLGVSDGAVATPSLHFASDTDTGFYHHGANTIGMSLAGALTTLFISGATSRIQAKGYIEVDQNSVGNGPGIWFDTTGSNPQLHIMPWNGAHANDRGLTIGDGQIGIREDKTAVAGQGRVTGWRNRGGATQSASATPKIIFSETLQDEFTYLFEATIVARDEDAGANRAFYRVTTGAHREGGGAVLTAISAGGDFAVESDSAWACSFGVSSNDIQLNFTGAAGRNVECCTSVRWIGTHAQI